MAPRLANEVFEAIESLNRATTRAEELDTVVGAASRLANTSHGVIVSAPAGALRAAHRMEDPATTFEPHWITWKGSQRCVSAVETAMADVGVDHPSILEPVDAVHGLAVEIPGPTAASAVLAVVGVRPPFLASEVARIERFASLVGRLHPLEPVLSGPIR